MTFDDYDFGEPEEKRLRVTARGSREAGSCCFCNRHSTTRGQAVHRVHEASGAGITVRFCDDCAQEFAAAVGYTMAAKARKAPR